MTRFAPIALLALLTGCAASKRPPINPAQARFNLAAPDLPHENVAAASGPVITSFAPLQGIPATDWRVYTSAGALQWFINSNACSAWRLSYSSNTSCWLYYNHRPEGARTVRFSQHSNDVVYLSEFVRVGEALPPGENSIVIPLPRESAGFVILKTSP